MRRSIFIFAILFIGARELSAQAGSERVVVLQPLGPTPSERQLAWHNLEFYGLIHFGINTFTDLEWGYGDAPATSFNPSSFDARQIVSAMKDAGMQGVVLVCKHHDGFYLWPTQTTDYCITNSPWREGKGDLVKEISDACRSLGLKFGVYLSPWDRHRADYGSPEYIGVYRKQLAELLTNYGELFTVWFDGAQGGAGFYGGQRGIRKVDQRLYYDWTNTWNLVRALQPKAAIFSDAGPDVRWVGNEEGSGSDPCWCTINASEV